MKLNLNNITFIIVCFKSENVIYNCLNSLPKECKKIVIENSKNIKLKRNVERKFNNIKVFLRKNEGVASSINYGVSKAKTKYIIHLSPDLKVKYTDLKHFLHWVHK